MMNYFNHFFKRGDGMRKTRGSCFRGNIFGLFAVLFAVSAGMLQAAPFVHQNSNRVNVNFNRGWLFNNTDNINFSTVGYSDASWTQVCLPQQNITVKHMYFNGGTVGSGAGAEFCFTSWYRKHYTPPTTYTGRRFILEFEGVSIIANVYVNGTLVGSHSGGYTPFTVDITGQIVTGQDNVIAVQVNSNRQTGVPPEGGGMDFCVFGGIVRNVHLIVADPLHVEWNWLTIPNAASQTSTPNGIVTSHVRVANHFTASKTCTATTSIVDNTGDVVATGSGSATIASGGYAVITYATTAAVSNFWTPDNPYLYTVYTQVQNGATYVDEYQDRTGFRTVYVVPSVASTGVYINGTRIKVLGLNRHETFPYFGRAAAKRLQRKDADILKYELGCNLVRCSHYTQAPDFIKRCDEIGLMLIQEVPGWSYIGGGSPNTAGTWQGLLMKGLKDMIYRDRNRPSVISFGVRVNESADNDALYGPMNDTARAIDPTRPTHGVRRSNGTVASFLEDIWTRNFADPTSTGPFPWMTTESVGHTITPQVHSWDNDVTQFGQINAHVSEQTTAQNNNYSVGKLGWCAFDYCSQHGNATTNELLATVDVTRRSQTAPYVSMHGVASLTRILKLAGYFFQAQRNPATCGYMVFIANDWRNGSPTTVTVFSNCPTVELFNNGTSLGTRTQGTGFHGALTWTGVTFGTGGTLRAVGTYTGGQVTYQVTTPGTPAAIVLTPDTNVIYDGGDMTRIVVSLVDASGRAVRSRGDSITMSASGAGDFVGEARSALEGGQMAFYVKTRNGVTGTITAQASVIGGSGISAGTTNITVIADPSSPDPSPIVNVVNTPVLTGVIGDPSSPLVLSANVQKTYMTRVWGNRVIVPYGISRICVYDIAGKLLYRHGVQGAKSIDLGKAVGASNTVYIVKFESERTIAAQ